MKLKQNKNSKEEILLGFLSHTYKKSLIHLKADDIVEMLVSPTSKGN